MLMQEFGVGSSEFGFYPYLLASSSYLLLQRIELSEIQLELEKVWAHPDSLATTTGIVVTFISSRY